MSGYRLDSPWVKPLPGNWEHLQKFGIRKIVPECTTIYAQGQKCGGFFYLHQGHIKISILGSDGGEKLLAVYEAPGIFGEAAAFDQRNYFATATSLTKSEIYWIPKEQIWHLAQDPISLTLLLQSTGRKLRLVCRQLEDMTFLDASARLAHVLLMLANDYGQPEEGNIHIQVPVTHQELAETIGVSRVTVTTIMNNFVRDNIIRTAPKSITIVDRNQLINKVLALELANTHSAQVD